MAEQAANGGVWERALECNADQFECQALLRTSWKMHPGPSKHETQKLQQKNLLFPIKYSISAFAPEWLQKYSIAVIFFSGKSIFLLKTAN